MSKTNFTAKELADAKSRVINLIGASPASIDEIISITKLPIDVVLTIIVELELAEKIVRHFGNKVSVNL